jgi:hypothetical protein
LSKEFYTGAHFPTDGVTSGYLGIELFDGTNKNYGFIELTTLLGNSKDPTDKIIIQGYGYEPVALTTQDLVNNTQNTVPEPSSLGLFAMGAVGLAMLRRWRSQAAKRNGSA